MRTNSDQCHTPALTFSHMIQNPLSAHELLRRSVMLQQDADPEPPPLPQCNAHRVDERSLGTETQEAFRNAICHLIEEEVYHRYVRIHAFGGHRMHGGDHGGPIGVARFLPWHRLFLQKFECELLRAHKALGGDPTHLRGIPYWRWNVDDPAFPAWLDGFFPFTHHPTSTAKLPVRTPGKQANTALPTPDDVDWILNESLTYIPDPTGAVNDHSRFSTAIEGDARRLNDSRVVAHNHVHAWVGGVFENVALSPCDPVFWLLHAEVDRLWHIWQQKHPGARPNLKGKHDVLTPWPIATAEVHEIRELGYEYDSDVP